ncbi:MAG: 50S ribosome-binding GTPase, partial [Alphaproteobacteria bacterium]|nr:50S ribosome-binding GTPase [Alphaproteobacteria bacterium]
TTLHPALGVVESDDEAFVLADIPGLIEGAHEGRGLGDRFLGHVERCRVLLHLIDPTMGPDAVVDAYRTVRAELTAYDGGLAEKPEIVALSKCDAISEADLAACREALAPHVEGSFMTLSAVARIQIVEALRALRLVINDARDVEAGIDRDQSTYKDDASSSESVT